MGDSIFYTPEMDYESLIKDKDKYYDNSLALYPLRNSHRIISQQGMFTLQGKEAIPLEEEHNGDLSDLNILKNIEISPVLIDDVKLYLKQSGISDFALFPDLDGLAREINNLGYVQARKNL